MMTDEEALALAKNGRPEGFNAMYVKFSGYLFTLALRMLRRREEAEDAVQETFAAAFRTIGEFRGESRLKTWFYTILYRAALKIQEKFRPQARVESLEYEPMPDTMGGLAARMDVRDLLDRLEPRDRAVLIMAYWDDLTCREIADVLGVKENHVKILLYRSRIKFSELWEIGNHAAGGNEQ